MRNSWGIAGAVALVAAILFAGYAGSVAMSRSGLPSTGPSAEDGPVAVDRPSDRPMKVLFAGDSLTFGLYATRQHLSFRPLMLKEWREDGPVDETTGQQAGAGVATVGNLVSVPEEIDLAVIELGTNDLTRTEVTTFAAQYGALLDKLPTGTPLVCAGTWFEPEATEKYDAVISEACAKHGGTYVQLSDLYVTPDMRGPAGIETWIGKSDTFHPNDRGHEMIARRLSSAVAIA